jgi:hypothetical protein
MDLFPDLESNYPYDAFIAASTQYSREILQHGLRVREGKPPDPGLHAPMHNVVGVTIGEKIKDGVRTGSVSVIFFVRRKYPLAELDAKDLLPTTALGGLPIDVVETGDFVSLGLTGGSTAVDPKQMKRPAPPGFSISGVKDHGGTGTFGALVRRASGAAHFILSNHHVLADPDNVAANGDVFQPGLADRPVPPGTGTPVTRIGQVAQVLPLNLPPTPNRVDAALASVLNQSDVTNEIPVIGIPAGTVAAVAGRQVRKFGRATGLRTGLIENPAVTSVAVAIPHADVLEFMFTDQIVIRSDSSQPFSGLGDSGSLVVDGITKEAVGLLFAGNQNASGVLGIYSLANPIDLVFSELDCTLA